MPPEKSNHFLDAEESDDDGSQGYHSAADEIQKGGRGAKRRKLDDNTDIEEDLSEAESERGAGGAALQEQDSVEEEEARAEQDTEETEGQRKARKSKKVPALDIADIPDISKPLTKKNLVATDAAIKKSGVVYLSRIPPFMKPAKLRSLLAPYGTINRVFLSPEDPAAHTRRVKAGGNKKRSFTDGWVEFVRKSDAKKACELLNARTIGGKKGTYYRDDIWSLLYLKGFKWDNLTEQIAAENAEHASRMRAEISRTTKENNEFMQNVEKAKRQDAFEARVAAKRKRKLAEDGEGEGEQVSASTERLGPEKGIAFKQRPVARKRENENQPDQVLRVLSKIF